MYIYTHTFRETPMSFCCFCSGVVFVIVVAVAVLVMLCVDSSFSSVFGVDFSDLLVSSMYVLVFCQLFRLCESRQKGKYNMFHLGKNLPPKWVFLISCLAIP